VAKTFMFGIFLLYSWVDYYVKEHVILNVVMISGWCHCQFRWYKTAITSWPGIQSIAWKGWEETSEKMR